MTRTKQTCKKSTGGLAKRIAIDFAPSTVDLNLDATMQEMLSDEETGGNEKEEMVASEDWADHNEWCIVCRGGSSGHESLQSLSTTMTSHSNAFVATWQCKAVEWNRAPRTLNNLPVLPTFLPIHSALEVSLQSQIASTPVVLINLALVDYDTSGGPFNLTFQFLSPYFPHGGIAFHELVFDVGSRAKSRQYQLEVGELVQGLASQCHWPHIVFVISNHTDDDLGDPFLGYESKKTTYVAGRVDSFLDIILTLWQPLIKCAKQSYLWLLSCGTLINNTESFSYLQTTVLHHHITATICFNAIHFQPTFMAPLLLAFAEQVLIESLPICEVFPDMLMQSNKLGRHTDMFLLTTDAGHSLEITRFTWMHCQERPWGHYLPLQCPQCGVGEESRL
ncbi:uncharacterized protein EDB91DRAFT_1247087 [Suillus paluster]|uniref:uncharacterized protein n=1 Tax=Suillus paluster TaxID=48578 RepID=UPI001B865D61|nr:uncharacterized protein EDB91DRAFT_1247087 [Suillus paluster]KAG1743584.1 hypothetical protein EDB91DRAFT_1247087 [Suillus paluster]